jgi:hypothetical protein
MCSQKIGSDQTPVAFHPKAVDESLPAGLLACSCSTFPSFDSGFFAAIINKMFMQ